MRKNFQRKLRLQSEVGKVSLSLVDDRIGSSLVVLVADASTLSTQLHMQQVIPEPKPYPYP